MKLRVFDDYDIFRVHSIELNPGYTVFIGPNGAGKTTLAKTIRDCIENREYHKNKYANFDAIIYSCDFNGDNDVKYLRQNFLMSSMMNNFALVVNGSEGQCLRGAINISAETIAKKMREAKSKSLPLMVFFDAIDSGLSIDAIRYVRYDYFKSIQEICKKEGIELYIIVCANNYEFVESADCIYPRSMKHYQFDSYEAYKKFILRTSKVINKDNDDEEEL